MTNYIIKDCTGMIIAAAAFAFPGSTKVNKEVIRGIDGGLYFKGDEPTTLLKSAEQNLDEIKVRLMQIDLDSVRSLRAIAAGESTQTDIDKIAKLTAEANALREQLSTLNAAAD